MHSRAQEQPCPATTLADRLIASFAGRRSAKLQNSTAQAECTSTTNAAARGPESWPSAAAIKVLRAAGRHASARARVHSQNRSFHETEAQRSICGRERERCEQRRERERRAARALRTHAQILYVLSWRYLWRPSGAGKGMAWARHECKQDLRGRCDIWLRSVSCGSLLGAKQVCWPVFVR